MDALLIIDATPDQFPSSPPQPLADLVDRARGVGGVIVHVAPEELTEAHEGTEGGEDRAAGGGPRETAEGGPGSEAAGRPEQLPVRHIDGDDDDALEEPRLRIDSALGTRDDELVLVSDVPDVFEGIDDLAEGLDDLGVDRIIVAGSNARDALTQSSFAALAIGFELIVVADGVADRSSEGAAASARPSETASRDSSAWITDAEAAGAVVKNGADVWLKM